MDMILHGCNGQEQLSSDLAVCEPTGECGGDVTLPRRERRRPAVGRGCDHENDAAIGHGHVHPVTSGRRRQRHGRAMPPVRYRVEEVERRGHEIVDAHLGFH